MKMHTITSVLILIHPYDGFAEQETSGRIWKNKSAMALPRCAKKEACIPDKRTGKEVVEFTSLHC